MDWEHELRALEDELARQQQVIEGLKFDVAAIEHDDRCVRFELGDEVHDRIGAAARAMNDVRPQPVRPALGIQV